MRPVIGAVLAAAAVLLWPTRARLLGTGRLDRSSSRAGRSVAGVAADRADRAERADRADRATMDHVVDAMTLTAMALSGGCSPLDAIEVVADVSPPWVADQLRTVSMGLRWGLDQQLCWAQVSPAWLGLARAIDLASEAGVPPARLVLDSAEELRARASSELDARVSALGVRLVLPLGLAFLPAFILTTVVPFVIALAASVLT